MQMQPGKPYLLCFGAAGAYQLILSGEGEVKMTNLRADTYSKIAEETLKATITDPTANETRVVFSYASERQHVRLDIDRESGIVEAHMRDPDSGNISCYEGKVTEA